MIGRLARERILKKGATKLFATDNDILSYTELSEYNFASSESSAINGFMSHNNESVTIHTIHFIIGCHICKARPGRETIPINVLYTHQKSISHSSFLQLPAHVHIIAAI